MAQFERLFIAQYCAARWPEGGYTLGVPLGPIPAALVKQQGYESAANFFRPWRPEIDAIKYFPDGILLLEAKVFRVLDAMAKLRWYGELVPSTEELRPWIGKEVTLRLVTTRTTDVVLDLAKISGVQIDVFQTPEVMEHAKKYENYWSAPYQRERELLRQQAAGKPLPPSPQKGIQ